MLEWLTLKQHKPGSPYSGGGARIGRQEACVFNGQTVTDGQPGLDSYPHSGPFPGGRFGGLTVDQTGDTHAKLWGL